MKRNIQLPAISLGAEISAPSLDVLAAWAERQRRIGGDLISFHLEESLKMQAGVDQPAIGGMWYGSRFAECIEGIREGSLIAEAGAIQSPVGEDAGRIVRMRKRVWFAAPAPSALGILDSYYNDDDEFIAALCEVYAGLMREQRDMGAGGHVLITSTPHHDECEALARRKIVFFTPECGISELELLLEYQDTIAVYGRMLEKLIVTITEYEPKRLIIVDPTPEAFSIAREYYDPDGLAAGGYCTSECGTYWKELKTNAVIPKDDE